MNVMAAGIVVRWEPEGYNIVFWHRHERLVETGCEDQHYSHLSLGELCDVVDACLNSYLPGTDPGCRGPVQQILEWGNARKPERT